MAKFNIKQYLPKSVTNAVFQISQLSLFGKIVASLLSIISIVGFVATMYNEPITIIPMIIIMYYYEKELVRC